MSDLAKKFRCVPLFLERIGIIGGTNDLDCVRNQFPFLPLPRVRGKNGNWFRTQSRSLVPPMIPIRSRKRGTHLNFFARSLIYAHVQTFSAAFFACGAGWPLPFISFSRSAVSCTSTRQLSLAAIARVQENCFASPLSISKIRRGKTGKLILRRISSPARLI